MENVAYGSWSSPITVEMMTSSSVGLGSPTVDRSDLYWTESRASEGGRITLFRRSGDGHVVELTPAPFYVRSRVHEYGGGEYAARAGWVVFSDFHDGRLYLIRDGQPPTPITPESDHRFADLRIHPDRSLVLAVREDHTGPGEAVNTVVALNLDGRNDSGGTVLCSGADFYASPELASDGRLAWTEWNHPNMPWDETQIFVGALAGTTLTGVVQVTGGPGESAIHPRWSPDGRLLFLSDRTNWWNLYAWSGGAVTLLFSAESDFTTPPWRLGQSPYTVIDDDRILVSWTANGSMSVGRLTLSSQELVPLTSAGAETTSLSSSGERAAAVLASPDRPSRLCELDLASDQWTDVRSSSEITVAPELVSVARAVSWASEQGPVYGWFYPPTNPGYVAPAGSLPPMITLSHGGPTASSPAIFDLSVQYWTSRGIAVLDVNYGGSTGYGRSYRQRLRGSWGLVDVADCAAGAVAMGTAGLADPHRLAISGGSAGGYTTLRALTATDVFSAGISLYGVGDLESLAKDTHKFESRYLDGLVGRYPEDVDVYHDRSPIYHLDQLSAPILLLQGADDMIVPPNQAETMAAAARAKGLPVALIIFPGEGHGFRRSENIKASIEAELYFLGRVYGFLPADQLPSIHIENLPG